MNFKEYRISRKMTQAQAGALLGMSASFWGSLESGQESVEREYAFARVLRYLDHPSINLPLTRERLASVGGYGLFYRDASRAIGAGDNTWSNIFNGHTESKKRWQLLCNALLIELSELSEKEEELKKQAELDLTPAGDIEIIQPAILTPGPEAPMVEPEITDQGLIPFIFNQSPVRCQMINGDPWFMLADVCRATGYQSIQHAITLIRERDIQKLEVTDSLGRNQLANFVSERGLSQFFLRARVPAVEVFQDWVFDEVLPAIKKTGQYQAPTIQPTSDPLSHVALIGQALQTLAQQMQAQAATIESQAQQIEQIKQQGPIDTDKAALQTLQKLQSLEARRNELHNLVAQVVSAADRSKHIIASSYCNYQAVWRAVFNASNPPVNKLAGYTSLAQINTGIEAAKQLLETLLGKAPAEQLKIEIEGDAA